MRLFALLLAFAGSSQAAVLVGTNYNGANLTVNNGDVLSGTFTAVGTFSIGAGNTTFVAAGSNLVIYAATVSIAGTLDGSGRGQQGGAGGTTPFGAGQAGFDAGGQGTGNGRGGLAGNATLSSFGGGGGGHSLVAPAATSGGAGAGVSGGAGGAQYDSTGTISGTISSGELLQGSGGGGGGGQQNFGGGNGAAGGGAIYIEAGNLTVTGSISVAGSTAPATADGAPGNFHAGGGGGGSGGTLILRVPGTMDVSGATLLDAGGGKGGSVDTSGSGTLRPGGGGSGGRIKLFYGQGAFSFVTLSTAAGRPGFRDNGFLGNVDAVNPPGFGSTGTVTLGLVAPTPTGFAALAAHATAIDWKWNPVTFPALAPDPSIPGGADPQAYRLYPASATILSNAFSSPLPAPQSVVFNAGAGGLTESGLIPNTTYYRFVTAFTSWGDSLPSAIVSTHTLCLAPTPGAPAFSDITDSSLKVTWTGGANSTSTIYELDESTNSNFSAPASTSFAMFALGVAPSSAPTRLSPNTTYYFQARAINMDNVPTAYSTTMIAVTSATPPSNPAATVYVTSVAFSWSSGANPPDTSYFAQLLTGVPLAPVASSTTLSTNATFFGLVPGTTYSLNVVAFNRLGFSTTFAATTVTAGILSDVSPPSAPGTPVPDRQFSYDGKLTLFWPAAASAVGILDYNLIVGSLPGASDFFNGTLAVTTYSAVGLTTGHTYYAQVRARSNAGVYGAFSNVSNGVSVFITSEVSPVTKPINWPNPFNPANGPTQIGFFIESPGSVTLKIFTLQGRLVHQASQDYGAQGNQIMNWDGNSDSGGRAAPGGYVCLIEKHLSSGTSSQKFKIALLY